MQLYCLIFRIQPPWQEIASLFKGDGLTSDGMMASLTCADKQNQAGYCNHIGMTLCKYVINFHKPT
ncbi:hypothetical protein Loa_00963 [Legionella oakridgensis ATCC 33761 = DSM 21215]|uniref:Uncharacterized protein n=2 Tax=Legionella oakridgensis TaxID=29423 RepID=W0BDM9_9GAMM|nr:hypothetical protein Loa_00963 [Legionella oakridgensis ATCC 33761 = DSM 21215]ETO93706.1 hypothetical protein LOR_62c15480 [Legionella oakridgensis RV-2-2007]KTD37866.1 hypothetical protein Loak_1542 [Legionella oakridgensis]STY19681.1 Uncharacterised protein [Legionella longbeachae]